MIIVEAKESLNNFINCEFITQKSTYPDQNSFKVKSDSCLLLISYQSNRESFSDVATSFNHVIFHLFLVSEYKLQYLSLN